MYGNPTWKKCMFQNMHFKRLEKAVKVLLTWKMVMHFCADVIPLLTLLSPSSTHLLFHSLAPLIPVKLLTCLSNILHIIILNIVEKWFNHVFKLFSMNHSWISKYSGWWFCRKCEGVEGVNRKEGSLRNYSWKYNKIAVDLLLSIWYG